MFGGGVRVPVDLIDRAGETNPTPGSDRVLSGELLTKSLNVRLMLVKWDRALSTSDWRVFSS